MTVCMVIYLLNIPYVHRIYVYIYGSGPPYLYSTLCNGICVSRRVCLQVMPYFTDIHYMQSLQPLVLSRCAQFSVNKACRGIGLAKTIYIYTVYARHFWQGNNQIYGHIRRIYTVLANPSYTL